jgi:hypothetical protein
MQRLHIDHERWAQLNSLLDAALDLPPWDRMAWLDALDPSLAPLKPQLRQLLTRAAREETGDFLGTLPKLDGGETRLHARPELAGQAVGPYRLLRELGSGGIGAVWLAQRSDGLINRPIALKFAARRVARARASLSAWRASGKFWPYSIIRILRVSTTPASPQTVSRISRSSTSKGCRYMKPWGITHPRCVTRRRRRLCCFRCTRTIPITGP